MDLLQYSTRFLIKFVFIQFSPVFGGFLMRQALELSWACCYQFCKSRFFRLRDINDIQFSKPVAGKIIHIKLHKTRMFVYEIWITFISVSSLLKMHAHVVYTEMNFIEIVVINETYDAISAEHTTTNVFYYTYQCDAPVPQIIPRTYNEAMWYLDGRRKFTSAMNLNGETITKIEGLKSPQRHNE